MTSLKTATDSPQKRPSGAISPAAAAWRPARRNAPAVSPAQNLLPTPAVPELLEGPTREDLIRRRAYDLYERNGRVDGHDVENWLAAEAEFSNLRFEASMPDATDAAAI